MLDRRKWTASSPLLQTAQRKPAHTEGQENDSEMSVNKEDVGLMSHRDDVY